MEHASIDGAITPAADALIPVTDEGLLRGDGAFEVIRRYDGVPFALDAHIERLIRSTASLRLEFDVVALRREIDALVHATPDADGLLRVLVTRSGRRIAITEPLPSYPDRLVLASVHYEPTILLNGVKTLSYAANMLATRIARERGAHEAILVRPDGRVLEAPTSTVFWAKDGVLYTPGLEGILESITRHMLREETGALEADCQFPELLEADEVFLASTTREVAPVGEIDGRVLPQDGPLTAEAGRALRARIERELAGA